MTAPDPGLTDLIAAHTLRVVALNEAVRYPECNGCDWVGGLVRDHAAHLALVVEPHATVGSKQWRAMFRANLERAEKAEATIARVEKALEGVCDSCDYTDLRAALEGES